MSDEHYWTGLPRQRLRRRLLLQGGAVAGGGWALFAAACGGKSNGTSSNRGSIGTPVGAAPASSPEAAKPKRGGTFRISGQISGDPPSLDYDKTDSSIMGAVANLAGSKLVQWNELPDRGETPVEKVLPDLATKWESADGLAWTFHLRQGAMSSTGREVTAEDVKWTFERQVGVQGTAPLTRFLPEMYTGQHPNVETPDKYTVVVKLSAPNADFLPLMGSHWWTVELKEVIPGTADGWGQITKIDQVRGSGPFIPTDYVPSSQFTFQRNPNYYDQNLPYVDTIRHALIAEPTAAAAALQAGQLDAFGPLTALPINIALDLEKVPSLAVKWFPGMTYWPWTFDLDHPPFNDARVRQALALSVDRKKWIQQLYFGRGHNATMIEPYLQFWYTDPKDMGEDGKYYTTYDPKEAKSLLAAAGYPNGFSYDVQAANIASYTVSYPMIELMQSMVADAGLKQNLKIIDYATHLKSPPPGGGIYQGWIVRPDIESFVYSQVYYKLATAGGKPVFQTAFERDPEYQKAAALMEKQRQTVDLNDRLKVVQDLQRVWARNVFMFYYPVPDSPIVASRKVHNFIPTPGWNAGVWKYVWLDS